MTDTRSSRAWTSWVAIAALLVALTAAALAFRPDGRPSHTTLTSENADVLRHVLNTKKTKVGVVPYAPIVIVDPATRELSGFAIDAMRAIGEGGGFEIEFEVLDWATMNAALAGGKIDAVVSAIFRNPQRAKEFTFTVPTMYFGQSAIVRADDQSIRTAADLKRPGLRVAVLAGEAGAEYVRRFMPQAQVTTLTGSDLTIPMMEVVSGRADIAFGDLATCRRFAANNTSVRNVFSDDPLNVSAACFMLRRGDSAWLDFLNVSIETLLFSGELDELNAKYNQDGIWIPISKPWQ